jgi:hypothetical protein
MILFSNRSPRLLILVREIGFEAGAEIDMPAPELSTE